MSVDLKKLREEMEAKKEEQNIKNQKYYLEGMLMRLDNGKKSDQITRDAMNKVAKMSPAEYGEWANGSRKTAGILGTLTNTGNISR